MIPAVDLLVRRVIASFKEGVDFDVIMLKMIIIISLLTDVRTVMVFIHFIFIMLKKKGHACPRVTLKSVTECKYDLFYESLALQKNTILSKSIIYYQTTKDPLQSLQLRQSKLVSSISMCQKKLSSIIISQKKLWSLGFDKDSSRSQREKFSVYLERKYLAVIMGSLNLAVSIIPCFCGHTNKGSFIYHM